MPDGLSYPEAATIPIAFLTAYYGLWHLARMSAGGRVLVPAAAGGVGQAAGELAPAAGGGVVAAVGRAAPPAVLEGLGGPNILNSRSLDFADEVMRLTDGRGVDIVLNSLAGEFIPKSLSVLAKGGRFVEIGKAGIWTAEQVADFKRDISYWAIDLAEISRQDPA